MEATLWPYGKCKKCENKNYCAWSESEILNCMNNGYPNFSPMRNADRFRAMTDDELAGYLAPCACPPIRFDKTGVIDCPVGKEPCESDCKNCWLDWLKQEADEPLEKLEQLKEEL